MQVKGAKNSPLVDRRGQHTLYGKQLLSNFLIDIAGITPDWSSKSFINHQLEEIARKKKKRKKKECKATITETTLSLC